MSFSLSYGDIGRRDDGESIWFQSRPPLIDSENSLLSPIELSQCPWPTPQPPIISRPYLGHSLGITKLAPTNDSLFSASKDGTVRKWHIDPAKGTAKLSYILGGHQSWVNDFVRIDSPDVLGDKNDLIVSVSHDQTLKIWNVYDDSICQLDPSSAYDNKGTQVPVMCPDNQVVNELYQDRQVEPRVSPRGTHTRRKLVPTITAAATLQLPDCDSLLRIRNSKMYPNVMVVTSINGRLTILDLNKIVTVPFVDSSVSLSRRNGLRNLYGPPRIPSTTSITSMEANPPKQLATPTLTALAPDVALWSLTLNDSGTIAFTGTSSGRILVYDMRQSEKPFRALSNAGHQDCVRDLLLTSDHILHSAASDSSVITWDLRKMTQYVRRHHVESVLSLTAANFSTASSLMSGGKDGLVLEYDMTADTSRFSIAATHSAPVTSLSYLNGNLWTGTAAGLITCWEPGSSAASSSVLANYQTNTVKSKWSNVKQEAFNRSPPQVRMNWRPKHSIVPNPIVRKTHIMPTQQTSIFEMYDGTLIEREVMSFFGLTKFNGERSAEQILKDFCAEDIMPVDPWMTMDVQLGYGRVTVDSDTLKGGIVDNVSYKSYGREWNDGIRYKEPLKFLQLPKILLTIFFRYADPEHFQWIGRSEELSGAVDISHSWVTLRDRRTGTTLTCFLCQLSHYTDVVSLMVSQAEKAINPRQPVGLKANEMQVEVRLHTNNGECLKNREFIVDRYETVLAVVQRLSLGESGTVRLDDKVINPSTAVGVVALHYFKRWPPKTSLVLVMTLTRQASSSSYFAQ